MAFIDEIIKLSIQAYKDFDKLLLTENGKYVKLKIKVIKENNVDFEEFITRKKEFEESKKAIKEMFLFDYIKLKVIDGNEAKFLELNYEPISRSWIMVSKR